jgi:hypothetical protein
MEEIWKDIPGYEGIYQASTEGRIRSLKFNKIKILKPGNCRGYSLVGLAIDGTKEYIQIHKLIAITFLNHKPDGHKLVIDHINGIRSDDRLENLRIVTQRENLNLGHEKANRSSKLRGVSWNKQKAKWCSYIQFNGKSRYLGQFESETEAHEAYQRELSKIIS